MGCNVVLVLTHLFHISKIRCEIKIILLIKDDKLLIHVYAVNNKTDIYADIPEIHVHINRLLV